MYLQLKTKTEIIAGTIGWIRSLAVDSQDNVCAGNSNGVYKSNGTSTFTDINGTSGVIYS